MIVHYNDHAAFSLYWTQRITFKTQKVLKLCQFLKSYTMEIHQNTTTYLYYATNILQLHKKLAFLPIFS